VPPTRRGAHSEGRSRDKLLGVSSPLSVLWVVPNYPWAEDGVGGSFHRTQARALARRGVAVRVAAPSPWSPWPLRLLRSEWRRYARAPLSERDVDIEIARPRFLVAPGHPGWLWPEAQVELGARLTSRHKRPSLVHGHFGMPFGAAAVRLGARWHVPSVVTLHGSDVNRWPETPGRLRELRAAVEGADVVTAVSGALAERAAELTGRRPIVLPIGVDIGALRAGVVPAAEARRRLGWPLSAPIVTFVGNLAAAKGVPELIAARAEVGMDVVVVLLGDGPLRAEISRAPAVQSGLVRLLGAVEHDEVPLYMAASDVVVLPSHSEGLPTVLVEAGALGVPVVASAVGGVPELLAGDAGWLCAPRNLESLVTALREALGDAEERSRRAAILQRRVEADYDVNVQAGRLIDIYRGLVERAG
jgi:teichuronic acid biosynthesis glycosyltransferase TuaC